MKLDLTELARTIGMRSVQEIDEPCPKELGLDCVSNVTGSLKLSNTGTLLLVAGSVKTEVNLPCGRCLTDVATPLESDIEEQFRIEKVNDAAVILPLEEEEEGCVPLVKNNILDVDELIRQNLLLVLPIQPLCRPECAGLCPTCGQNLNVGECRCPPAEVESPFQVLADLLEEDNEA